MADEPGDTRRGTRERILEAAEGLFAERGFETVSLRDITGVAEANVAAVNYHFGSKDQLIDAVVARHVMPVNEDRLQRLDRLEEAAGEGALQVEEILEAFLAPLLSHISSGRMSERLFTKFMGRLMSEEGQRIPSELAPLLQTMAMRFTEALRRALPTLSEQQALWRMHYSFGVMANTLTHGDTLKQLSGGRSGEPSLEEHFDQIVAFCASGIRAGTKGVSSE